MWRQRLFERINQIHHALHSTLDVLSLVWAVSFAVYLVPSELSDLPSALKTTLTLFHIVGCLVVVAHHVVRWVLRQNHLRYWDHLRGTPEFKSAVREWKSVGLRLDDVARVPLNSHAFATNDHLVQAATDMNRQGFSDTQWGQPEDALSARNHGLAGKNPYSFLLLSDPVKDGVFIGFSCVLPLNEAGSRAYLEGRIPDTEMRSEYLAPPDGEAKALVIFAIYLDKGLRFPMNKAAANYMLYLLGHVRWHVQFLRALYGGPVPVYAQVARRGLRGLLEEAAGFEPSGYVSADGYKLLRLAEPTQTNRSEAAPETEQAH